MSTHTPGPWKIQPDTQHKGKHPNHDFRYVTTADFDEDECRGHVLAKLTDAVEIRGNAHLIAAAPELLAACKAIVAAFDGPTDCTDILDMIGDEDSPIRAAIRKADGPTEGRTA